MAWGKTELLGHPGLDVDVLGQRTQQFPVESVSRGQQNLDAEALDGLQGPAKGRSRRCRGSPRSSRASRRGAASRSVAHGRVAPGILVGSRPRGSAGYWGTGDGSRLAGKRDR